MKQPPNDRAKLNMALSVADPELRKLAERFAKLFPDQSIFRSESVERIMGIFKAWLESRAEGMSPLKGAATEKLTDFLDFFAAASAKNPSLTANWLDAFAATLPQRISAADDPLKEKERAETEFKVLCELTAQLDQEKKNRQPKSFFQTFGEELEEALDKRRVAGEAERRKPWWKKIRFI